MLQISFGFPQGMEPTDLATYDFPLLVQPGPTHGARLLAEANILREMTAGVKYNFSIQGMDKFGNYKTESEGDVFFLEGHVTPPPGEARKSVAFRQVPADTRACTHMPAHDALELRPTIHMHTDRSLSKDVRK